MALRKPKTFTWFDMEWMNDFNKGWLVMMGITGVLALVLPMIFGISPLWMILVGIVAFALCLHFKQSAFSRGWAVGMVCMGVFLWIIPISPVYYLLLAAAGFVILYGHDRLFAKYY